MSLRGRHLEDYSSTYNRKKFAQKCYFLFHSNLFSYIVFNIKYLQRKVLKHDERYYYKQEKFLLRLEFFLFYKDSSEFLPLINQLRKERGNESRMRLTKRHFKVCKQTFFVLGKMIDEWNRWKDWAKLIKTF